MRKLAIRSRGHGFYEVRSRKVVMSVFARDKRNALHMAKAKLTPEQRAAIACE